MINTNNRVGQSTGNLTSSSVSTQSPVKQTSSSVGNEILKQVTSGLPSLNDLVSLSDELKDEDNKNGSSTAEGLPALLAAAQGQGAQGGDALDKVAGATGVNEKDKTKDAEDQAAEAEDEAVENDPVCAANKQKVESANQGMLSEIGKLKLRPEWSDIKGCLFEHLDTAKEAADHATSKHQAPPDRKDTFCEQLIADDRLEPYQDFKNQAKVFLDVNRDFKESVAKYISTKGTQGKGGKTESKSKTK